MNFWTVMVFLHLVAMAFFLGGQMMLAGTVVPVLRSKPDPTEMKAIARLFGLGSLIALSVSLLTGMLMASHFELWGYGPFQVKMTLVILTLASLLTHLKYPKAHALMGLTFLLTLATVWAGVNMYH